MAEDFDKIFISIYKKNKTMIIKFKFREVKQFYQIGLRINYLVSIQKSALFDWGNFIKTPRSMTIQEHHISNAHSFDNVERKSVFKNSYPMEPTLFIYNLLLKLFLLWLV
jgi:hypothetical protein